MNNFSAKSLELEQRRLSYLKRRRIIRIALGGTILLAIIFFCLYQFTDLMFKPPEGLSSTPAAGDWAMFRHDLGHTGTNNPSGPQPKGKLKWVFSTEAAIHSSPAVVGGTVYFGSRDGKLYALDVATGNKLWEFQTGSWVDSSPAVVNGVVYFGSNDGRLYAIDAATGSKRWDFETRFAIKSSPAVADGIVYFGSTDYHIYALEAATGKKLWNYATGGYVNSSPAVADGIVYAGSMDGYFYAWHAKSGRVRLKFDSGSTVASSPVVADQAVYFTSSKGSLFCLDPKARNWPLENNLRTLWLALYLFGVAPQPPLPSGLLWSLTLGPTTASPAIANNTLYISSGTQLLAIDIQTHQVRWTFQADAAISSSPALLDHSIYLASEGGRLYALDITSGKKLWDIFIGDRITSSPAVVDGTIYVGSHNGKLYAID